LQLIPTSKKGEMSDHNSSLSNLLSRQQINDSEQIPLLSNQTENCKHGTISGYGRGIVFRIVILLCISFLAFGGYFAFDSISALEISLTEVFFSLKLLSTLHHILH
jgi:hypothetical protein